MYFVFVYLSKLLTFRSLFVGSVGRLFVCLHVCLFVCLFG